MQVGFAADQEPPNTDFGVAIDPLLRPGTLPTSTGQESVTKGDEDTRKRREALNYSVSATRSLLLSKITNVLLSIAGVIAIFAILNNAFYIIASGGGEAIDARKKGLMWAIIGLILIILSYSIIRFIISIPLGAGEEPAAQTQSSTQSTTPSATNTTLSTS